MPSTSHVEQNVLRINRACPRLLPLRIFCRFARIFRTSTSRTSNRFEISTNHVMSAEALLGVHPPPSAGAPISHTFFTNVKNISRCRLLQLGAPRPNTYHNRHIRVPFAQISLHNTLFKLFVYDKITRRVSVHTGWNAAARPNSSAPIPISFAHAHAILLLNM